MGVDHWETGNPVLGLPRSRTRDWTRNRSSWIALSAWSRHCTGPRSETVSLDGDGDGNGNGGGGGDGDGGGRRWANSLDVAEGVHGDHDAGLARLGGACKVDGARVGLARKVVEVRARIEARLVLVPGLEVRLGRARPRGDRHLRVVRALHAAARGVCARRAVHEDVGLRPGAEADEGARRGRGGDARGGHGEYQVHRGVEVEEEHHGRARVGEEGDEEENDAVLEKELPEGRTTRGHEETNGRNNKDDKIDEHGYKRFVRARP